MRKDAGTSGKPDACRPLARMMAFSTMPDSKAMVATTLAGIAPPALGTAPSVALLAYEQADAEQVLTDIGQALKVCEAGFRDLGMTYSAVTELPAPTEGDDGIAYRLVGDAKGMKVPMAFTVVRSGSTIAALYNLSIFDPQPTGGAPSEVVKAQISKLEKAVG